MSNAMWYEKLGENSDIVVSTRIRLARNLKDLPFPRSLKNKDSAEVINRVKSAVSSNEVLLKNKFKYIDVSKLNKINKLTLLEHHLISPDLAGSEKETGLIVSEDESVSIMINEEDHLRLQVMDASFDLEKIYSTADFIDSALDKTLHFAFDDALGYLTQCPTNLGTGMRASLMLHLPALKKSNIINKITSNLLKLGLTIRGIYGEGTEPIGDMYQLSNQVTLGLSEKEAIKNLKDIASQLIKEEQKARNELKNDLSSKDEIHRSFGILTNCVLLGSYEFMNLISNVRLGIAIGEIKNLDFNIINKLIMNVQSASILYNYGETLSGKEQNKIRADIVKSTLVQK